MLFIKDWMNNNHLKLNSDKTEIVISNNRLNIWSPTYWPKTLCTPPIPKSAIKSLGIQIDSNLSMQSQISMVTSSCFYQLRNFRKI